MNNMLTTIGVLAMCSALNAEMIEYGKLPKDFSADDVVQRQIQEVVARGGLPNFWKKLTTKAPEVTVAYFGGSITEQNGFRVHSTNYLQNKFPDTKIIAVQAAIGGTNSELGAFRLEHDVLKSRPDMVLVEFAVNDSNRSPRQIIRTMEGIVRHIWKQLPETDILFVYTLTERDIPVLQSGMATASSSAMETVADYYGIPSVNFGGEISRLVAEGRLVMRAKKEGMTRVSGAELNIKADSVVNADGMLPVNAEGKIPFSADGVHPYENTGHALYEGVLERSLVNIVQAGQCGPHPLPAPIVANCLEDVKTISLGDPRVKLTGPWRLNAADDPVTGAFLKRCDEFYMFEGGAKITFRFRGSKVSVYDLLGPQGAVIDVTVDNGKPSEKTIFDSYCTYNRLALTTLADNLDPDAVHTVTIDVTARPVDKRTILFDRNKPDFDAHPDKYAANRFYGGCIFIVGELVDAVEN